MRKLKECDRFSVVVGMSKASTVPKEEGAAGLHEALKGTGKKQLIVTVPDTEKGDSDCGKKNNN